MCAALSVPGIPWITGHGVLISCAVNTVPEQAVGAVVNVPVENAGVTIPDVAVGALVV